MVLSVKGHIYWKNRPQQKQQSTTCECNLNKLKQKPTEIIIDGPLLLRKWNRKQKNIVSGDSKFTSIASASIVAKVSRDNLMERLEKKYSGYLIFKNKGYGTREHLSIIKKYGITNLHRKSFLKKSKLI